MIAVSCLVKQKLWIMQGNPSQSVVAISVVAKHSLGHHLFYSTSIERKHL